MLHLALYPLPCCLFFIICTFNYSKMCMGEVVQEVHVNLACLRGVMSLDEHTSSKKNGEGTFVEVPFRYSPGDL